jgi:hypothetical protein
MYHLVTTTMAVEVQRGQLVAQAMQAKLIGSRVGHTDKRRKRKTPPAGSLLPTLRKHLAVPGPITSIHSIEVRFRVKLEESEVAGATRETVEKVER